jgi:hypothetical protein
MAVGSVLMPLLALLLVGEAWAAPPGTVGNINEPLIKPLAVSHDTFNVNTISCLMTNDGLIVDDRITGSSGMEWPKGSDKTIDFASGLWLVGIGQEDSIIYTACAEYASELVAGPVGGNSQDPAYRIYKINKDGTGDWDEWPVDQGAPVDDMGNPRLYGDQTLFWVCNDSNAAQHSNVFGSRPMGVEIHVTVFGFNRSDPMGNIMFVRWDFIHKGTQQFDSCYVALWDDPDLGDASDDLVGCDTTLGLGYCYNGYPSDATYGSTPPALGFDFFQGPEVPDPDNPDSTIYLGMTAFAWYWNGAPDPFDDPEIPSEAYWFMNGYAGDGTPYTDKDGNVTSPFPFAGDPVTDVGDLDGVTEGPGDRRFLMSSGPFTLAPGDTQSVLGAKIIAPGTDNLKAITSLRYFDTFAQLAYDEKFDLPSPPAPEVHVAPRDREIVLNWEENYEEVEAYAYKGYVFEGYNVYQGESVNGPWTRIATYDVDQPEDETPIDLIFDLALDPETGMILSKPVQFGSESGLYRYIFIDEDALTQEPLNNYRTYYFAVTAYAFNPDSAAAPRTVESAKDAYIIFPQERFEENASVGDTIEVTHTVQTGTLLSDGQVVPLVMDPYLLNGHEYEVTFYEAEVVVEEDTLTETRWKLTDKTDNVDLLVDKTYQEGKSEFYDFVDNMLVKVMGPALAIKSWEWSEEDSLRWFSGVNWGGSAMGGGMDVGQNFFWSTLSPGDYRKVEVRFSLDEADWTNCKVYRRDQGYAVQPDMGTFPGSAWDIDADPARRLNICFVENDFEAKPANLMWDPTYDTIELGGREYLFIMNSDYDAATAGGYDDENFGPEADVQFAWWPRVLEEHEFMEAEGILTIIPNYVNTPNDVFTFTATTPAGGADVKKVNLDKINVVPNPYFAFNPQERIATNRFVTFTHLPFQGATIRIFTLDGTLVKIIDDEEREDQRTIDTPMAYWYLRNEGDVPVASGMYLAHIEVEEVGDKILKIAVFMPEERLDFF